MKQPRTLLSLATIASSVLLATAFVSCQSGVFNGFVDKGARPENSGSSSTFEQIGADGAGSGEVSPQPGISQQPSAKSTEKVIMNSSKSFEPSRFITGLTPANPSSAGPELPKPSQEP